MLKLKSVIKIRKFVGELGDSEIFIMSTRKFRKLRNMKN